MAKLLLQEHTRSELNDLAPTAMLVLPVGAVEQHGPHLPVGTDFFAVEHIARSAASEAAAQIPVIVAPTLPFGSSHHHLIFGATLSLATQPYYQAVYDLAETAILSGFQRLFIVNGHGGNDELVQLVARDLALKHPAHLAAASYWTIAWDALIAEGAHETGLLPGHAGVFETSLMMALRPDLVKEPRPHRDELPTSDPRSFYAPYRAELHGAWQKIDGYTDSPDRATAALGERYLEAISQALAATLVEFYMKTEHAT